MDGTRVLEDLFYPGNHVQVEFYDESGNKNSFPSFIQSLETDRLVLELIPRVGVYLHLLKTNAKVYLIAQTNDDLTKLYFSAQVTQTIPGQLPVVILTRPEKIEVASRRNFFRCDVNLPLIYYIGENEFIGGKVTNLSASGFYGVISANPALSLHQVISGQFFLPSISQNITFKGGIVRLSKLKDSRLQGLAINFVDASESWQNKIVKYLFQRQRELIRRGRFKAF